MNIVIPMAGLGSRFSKSGFTLPKPLIDVGGKPMYRHAVDCLPLLFASRVIFILKEDKYSDMLETDIVNNYSHLPLMNIVKLKNETQGQADTILQAQAYFDLDDSTLVHNCDTYFEKHFDWDMLWEKPIDGAILLFSSQESRWSYALLDTKNQFIIDIQEKKVISEYASTGTYFFKNTHLLFALIQKDKTHDIRQNNEFYLSSIYQSMLRLNKKIIPLWTKNMLCFGTPQDLVNSLNYLLIKKGGMDD